MEAAIGKQEIELKTFFVTGATGFVGRAVVELLLERGERVVAVVRGPASFSFFPEVSNLEYIVIPEGGLASHRLSFGPGKESSIIHCAWSGVAGSNRNDRVQLRNIDLTLDILEFAKLNGIERFIGVGSQAEYGPKAGLIVETDQLAPTHLYGASKAAAFFAAEGLARNLGIQFSWARIFSVYGPHDAPSWLIPSVIDTLYNGHKPRLTKGEQIWDYLYVRDAAEALVALAQLSSGIGAVNLGSGKTVGVRTVVEMIRDKVQPGMELIFGQEPYRPDQVMHLEADINKLKLETGWSPATDIERGLDLTIQSRVGSNDSLG